MTFLLRKTQLLPLNNKKKCTKIRSQCHCKWFPGWKATFVNPRENWSSKPAPDLIKPHVFCTALSIFFPKDFLASPQETQLVHLGASLCRWAGQDSGDNTSAIMAMSVVFWGSELWEREEVQRRSACHAVCHHVDGFTHWCKKGVESNLLSLFFFFETHLTKQCDSKSQRQSVDGHHEDYLKYLIERNYFCTECLVGRHINTQNCSSC